MTEIQELVTLTDNVVDEDPYRKLAAAVIIQMVEDYRDARATLAAFSKFDNAYLAVHLNKNIALFKKWSKAISDINEITDCIIEGCLCFDMFPELDRRAVLNTLRTEEIDEEVIYKKRRSIATQTNNYSKTETAKLRSSIKLLQNRNDKDLRVLRDAINMLLDNGLAKPTRVKLD